MLRVDSLRSLVPHYARGNVPALGVSLLSGDIVLDAKLIYLSLNIRVLLIYGIWNAPNADALPNRCSGAGFDFATLSTLNY